MTKVLITGGAGYIGSKITEVFLKNNFYVTVLDNLIYGGESLIPFCGYDRFQFIRGDITNKSLIKDLISKNEVILPLAAIVGAPACDQNPTLSHEINFTAAEFIINNLSKGQKLIFPTTNSGYGVGQEGIYCDENTPLKPISQYGRDKVDIEKKILDSSLGCTLRLATVFGSSNRLRLDLLVNNFTYLAYSLGNITLYQEHFKRNYIHILDVVGAFSFALSNYEKMKGNPYNVGLTSANLSKRELCNEIKKQIPNLVINSNEFSKDPDQRNYIVSNKKIEDLGWRPKYDLQYGIKELIKSFELISKGNYYNY